MDATGRWKRTKVQAHVGLRAWLGSALFRSYLRRFVLLWIAGKLANVLTARVSGVSPYAFRPGTELVIFGFELGVFVIVIKNANEDVLLGNLGLRLSAALAPLALVHVILSAALAVIAG